MDDNFIYLSQEKITDLKDQLSKLESRMKMINAEQMKRGGLADSWHETASHAVTTSAIENKMYELQRILMKVKEFPIIKNPKQIMIGCHIDLEDSNGNKYRYQLVHPLEADPQKLRISIESPLGKLVINKHMGDELTFGERKFKIIKVY